jgi:predicted DNA-binding protein with PD1-like motif
MKSRSINQDPKTFVLVFDTGDEVAVLLKRFAQEQRLDASHFSGIGALSDITLGYFDPATKNYNRISINEQVEVLSLLGNVALEKHESKIHAHVVVGKKDGTAHGGHLIEAHVRPTLEVVIEESPQHLRRKFDEQTGLALIDLDA